MIKKTILAFVCLLSSANISAQKFIKHEFSVGVLGGISSLKHDLADGENKSKFSGGIGFGYTYFFKKNIGLATGLDFHFYNTDITLNEFSGTDYTFDLDLQEKLDFRYTAKNYKEAQNAFYLNVPIMLHYQFTDGNKVSFYGAGGAKIGLPISGKYKTSGANIKTTGYYPDTESLREDPTFRGFGDFVGKQYNKEIKYKMSMSLALELGAKWKLPKETALYTGIFMDYGINDIHKKVGENMSLISYNQMSPADHIYNGVSSSRIKTDSNEPLVKKINTMAYGVKVRFAFGKN